MNSQVFLVFWLQGRGRVAALQSLLMPSLTLRLATGTRNYILLGAFGTFLTSGAITRCRRASSFLLLAFSSGVPKLPVGPTRIPGVPQRASVDTAPIDCIAVPLAASNNICGHCEPRKEGLSRSRQKELQGSGELRGRNPVGDI